MPNPKRGEEIERVFKVRRLPKQIGSCPRDNIVQGYLAIEDEGPEVRLRKSGDHYYETFKGSGLLQRQELEIE
jgi:adenylate cyclase